MGNWTITQAVQHPHAFSCLIMCLYTLNCTRYAFAGDLGRVCYWACAAGITASVTWGMR